MAPNTMTNSAVEAIQRLDEEEQFDEAIIIEGVLTLCERAFDNSEKHGFWEGTPRPDIPAETCGSKIALMHSELSEALEGVRKPGPDKHCPEFTNEEIELADVLIRIGDYAAAKKLRLAEAVIAKMKFNESRPYKHGKTI